MPSLSQKAAGLYKSSLNCAQSVVAVFAEKYGVDRETAQKIASGFGAGVRSGEVCGAASGAVMVIGLASGYAEMDSAEAKAESCRRTEEFLARFKAAHGPLTCRGLLGCDLGTEEGKAKIAAEPERKAVCPELIASAVEILEELGY